MDVAIFLPRPVVETRHVGHLAFALLVSQIHSSPPTLIVGTHNPNCHSLASCSSSPRDFVPHTHTTSKVTVSFRLKLVLHPLLLALAGPEDTSPRRERERSNSSTVHKESSHNAIESDNISKQCDLRSDASSPYSPSWSPVFQSYLLRLYRSPYL